MSTRRILRAGASTAVAAVLALGGGALGVTTAHAQDFGPDTCRQGFVWRDARPGDHVCVTPDIRSQAAFDNSQVPFRTQPDGFCVQGFVWREAWVGDTVCVTPETRSQTRFDNGQADDRRLAVRIWADDTNGRLELSGDHFNVDGRVRLQIVLNSTGTVEWSQTVTAVRNAGFAGGSFGQVTGNPFNCGTKNATARAIDLTSGRVTASIPVGYCVNFD